LLNTPSSDSRSARLTAIWQRLVTPVVTIDDPGDLYKARVLASVFLISILVVIVFIVLPFLLPGYEMNNQWETILRLLSLLPLLLGYGMCRRGWTEQAVGWVVVVDSGILVLQAAVPDSIFGVSVLYYLGVVIMMSGLFASARITVIVFVFQLISVLLLLMVSQEITLAAVLIPMLFNTLMTFFTIAGVYYRRRLDNEKNARLQHSETRYRALVDSISDILYALSPEGVFTSVNPAITTAIGWLPEQLLGKPFVPMIHVDDRMAAIQVFRTVLSGQIVPHFEVRVMAKDGHYSWLDNASTPHLKNDQIIGVTGSARDITARKQAELARKQTEQRLSILVEQMPLAVIEINLIGLITGWNPAAEQIFGYTAAEALQKENINLLVPDHLLEHVTSIFERVTAEGDLVHSINENKTREGRLILCEWFNILLRDEDDKPVGILSVATDITERHQTNEQRLKLMLVQERMLILRRFMGAFSHDFRTALSRIETSRYLLERGLPSEIVTQVRPRFDNISASVRHMVTQLGNLNTVTTLSDLHLAPGNLNKLVQHLVDGCSDLAASKNLSLALELAAALPPFPMDYEKINNALLHLLNNAIAYTPPDGSIRLRTRFDDQHVYVDVIDSGIGIAPEHLSRIFDLFYRVDDARSFNTGGVGLGLNIARLVAEAHGGSITVTSVPGQGSTFTLTLPASQPAVAAEPAY
jgi:PAS domain S-box-containing protein